jgi:DNA-directed RNA polymerase specialized sigma24 family protein
VSRGQHYGKLGVAKLPSEVKAIWYSRDVEPDPVEPIDYYWPVATDPDLWLMQDFAKRLVEITPLTEAEEQVIGLCVIQGCTLEEAGEMIGKKKERVRQILEKGLRRFRRYQELLTGVKPWELDPREVSWFWWKYENRRSK